MSPERRFSQKEIAAIFNRASKAQEIVNEEATREEGLTLADLHLIALETGISPDLITKAVIAVDQTPDEPKPSKFLGLRLSVSKTVNLDNPLTDTDWDKLVVELRDTFHAQGKVTRDGSLREWSNGNLRVLVEPTSNGHRLHMRTLKGNAKGGIFGSFSIILAALVMFVTSAIAGGIDGGVLGTILLFSIAGLIGTGFTTLQLSQWRFDRSEQFETIASKAIHLTSKNVVAQRPSKTETVLNTSKQIDEVPPQTFDSLKEGAVERGSLMDGVAEPDHEHHSIRTRERNS